MSDLPEHRAGPPARGQQVALVDLLDRLLAGGVVIVGDITISIAQVDLVRISLRALIASIRPEMERLLPEEPGQGRGGEPGEEEGAVPSPYEPVRVTVSREDERP